MTLQIGDTFTSNNFGRYRVGKLDGEYAWIVFENTGNVEHPSVRTIVANGVIDYKGPYHIRVGGLYNTNNYGKVKVVTIDGTKSVTVEFVDTGNRVMTQKNNVLAGLLTDKMAIALIEKEVAEKRAEETRKMLEERRLARKELQESKMAAAARVKAEKDAERVAAKAVQRTLDSKGNVFIGTVHTDNLDMAFTVIDRVDGTNQWVVRYAETGNEYRFQERQIVKKFVADKKRDDYFELKSKYDKIKAALWYQENREHAIKRACEYQKNNLDRSRVNNQNRRARRNDNAGTHTFDEVEHLLNEQNHMCACCKVALTSENKHLDHIYPLALGGTNYIWNLQWLCQFCNNSKSATHPDEWAVYSKSEHFQAILKSRG